MSEEANVFTSFIKSWETIATAAVGILAIFGIVIGKKRGNAPVTNKDIALLELRIENRISGCAADIKKTISDSTNDVYNHIDKKDSHTNERIDKMLSNKG